jgi:hypothetical protein
VLGRPRHKLDDNNKMDLKGIRLEGMYQSHLAEDRDEGWAVVNMVAIKCREFLV